ARSPDVPGEVRLIRTTVGTAMHELRTILGVLREAGHGGGEVAPADAIGTRADVTHLVNESRAAGVKVELDWIGADLTGAPPSVRRAVHRVVREALTNVHRHAGGAPARVVVERNVARVRVSVRNEPRSDTGSTVRLHG